MDIVSRPTGRSLLVPCVVVTCEAKIVPSSVAFEVADRTL